MKIIKITHFLFITFVLISLTGCLRVYQSIGHNHGAFFATVSGEKFSPISDLTDHENKALLYIYRPNSEWAEDEVEAPSFYLNDERIANIRANGYTWFELEPGEYEIVMRRPLLGLEGFATDDFEFDIKRIAQLNLEVQENQVYYLRYSEIDPPSSAFQVTSQKQLIQESPLILVTTDLALQELAVTRMLPEGGRFIEPPDSSTIDELEDVSNRQALEISQEGAPETNITKWW